MNIFFKKHIRPLFILGCLHFLSIGSSQAQGFSYVYIQGDKKTPIYTKVEGVMMPRYGKNYALLARLAPGPLSVEVLFQQNEYPAAQFNILVPENGKRAFVLQHKDGSTYLYDVEQNFYLKTNNDIAEDHLPTTISNNNLILKQEKKTTVEASINNDSAQSSIQEPPSLTVVFDSNLITTETAKQNKTLDNTQKENSKDATFIEGIVFDNEKNSTTTSRQIQEQRKMDTTVQIEYRTNDRSIVLETPDTKAESNSAVTIVNSDCTNIISNSYYSKITNNLNNKKNENERLGIILEACKNNCFSTEQSIEMLSKLESDVAKLTAIKKLYSRTTDQGNFGKIENIIIEEEWKEYFRNSILQK